ncbi:2-oxoacid:acceptor oxidoreductase family protein [Desulfoscipio geothermicus]|uniref:2-oxoglutarate ferredoxin oxidoreductase subunit gamma n=1 Tax=Desulfoscipio geothermicus DSM 3669 TaxID=1121426 RepID=A0A1I6D490_9FIRM|nr:2-oxoacid:acceptor oxidoreductase family protein [Desulfoscipio geothermicus]SFR00304.1 2-oxoglutarate ferredoxin oxidoreductase subunit gamma [Desulfoscipio geothermicus DSM 3669]
MKEWQILLSGSGGQGLGLAGKILAEAALYRGLHAAHSQSYGARARGGYSDSGVVISSAEIAFPLIEKPNLLLALSPEAYHKNARSLDKDGYLIYDTDIDSAVQEKNARGFPITKAARETGNERGAAILALGIITGLFDIIAPKDGERAIADNLPAQFIEPNLQCYRRGLEMAGQVTPGDHTGTAP